MQKLKRYAALVLVCTLTLLTVPPARASAYDDHPKLIVIVVLDQFRADFLERFVGWHCAVEPKVFARSFVDYVEDNAECGRLAAAVWP